MITCSSDQWQGRVNARMPGNTSAMAINRIDEVLPPPPY